MTAEDIDKVIQSIADSNHSLEAIAKAYGDRGCIFCKLALPHTSLVNATLGLDDLLIRVIKARAIEP